MHLDGPIHQQGQPYTEFFVHFWSACSWDSVNFTHMCATGCVAFKCGWNLLQWCTEAVGVLKYLCASVHSYRVIVLALSMASHCDACETLSILQAAFDENGMHACASDGHHHLGMRSISLHGVLST